MPITNDAHEVKIDSDTKVLRVFKETVSEAVPQHLDPLELTMDDWHGGHGTFRWNGKPVYYDGESIDTSKRGVITVGGGLKNLTRYAFLKKAFRYDKGTTTYTDDTTDSQDIGTDDMELMEAAPEVDDAYYFGFTNAALSMKLNLSTAGAGTWTITWETSAGVALTGVSDGTTGFTAAAGLKTVSWTTTLTSTTVNGTAAYWIRARVSAYTSITTQPLGRQAWETLAAATALGEAPVAIAYFGATATSVLATTTKVWEIDLSDTTCYQRVTLTGETITDLCEFDGVMYVGIGSASGKFWYYTTDADTYTQTDLTNAQASYLFAAPNSAGTAFVLWSAKTTNELYSTTNGKTAAAGGVALSSAAYIGDTSENITNIFMVGDKLMVGREDGLFYYDNAGGVHPLMPELRANRTTNNFKYTCEWQGNVYCSLGSGLAELTPYDSYSMVGPLDNVEHIDNNLSKVVGVTADREYIYCTVVNTLGTAKAHIYKGWKEEGRIVWCPWATTGTGNTSAVSLVVPYSDSYRALLVSSGNDIKVAWIYDNPINPGTDYSNTEGYPATSVIRFPYAYGTDENWDKLFQSIILEGYALTANNTVTIKYRKDSETSMTACTSALTTNGVTENNLSSALNCKRIQFEIDFAMATLGTDTPPYVTYYEVRGVEQPEVTRVHDVQYYAFDSPSTRTTDVRDFLRTARTTTSLIRLGDLRYGVDTVGTTYVWVMPEVGYPIEEWVEIIPKQQPTLIIRMRWKEISFTIS